MIIFEFNKFHNSLDCITALFVEQQIETRKFSSVLQLRSMRYITAMFFFLFVFL